MQHTSQKEKINTKHAKKLSRAFYNAVEYIIESRDLLPPQLCFLLI